VASAQSRVELIVEAAKAINPLRRVEAQTKKLDQALKKNQKAARDVEAAFQRLGRTGVRSIRDLESNAQRLGRSMGGLRGAVGKVVVGFAAFKSIQGGIDRIESERKLRLLAREFGEIEHVQAAAGRAAKRFGLSQTEANQALGKIYARLRPVGIGLADIESTFNGFNTAAKLAGATAGESAGAFLQLSQALGSGFLRGQEFNSVLEQAPLIGIAIAKEMGVAVGQLKDLGAEGKITSATVIQALKRIETEGADKLKEAMGGPGQAVKNFQNAIEDLQVAVTKDAMPQLTTAFSELALAIKELAPALRVVGQVAAQVFSVIGGLARRTTDMLSGAKRAQAEIQASAQGQQLARERFGPIGMLSQEGQAFREQVEKNFMFNFDAQQRMALEAAAGAGTLPALPNQPLPTGTGGGDKKAGKFQMPGFAGTGMDPGLTAEQSFAQQVEQIAQGNMLLQARLEGGEREEQQRQQIASIIEQSGFVDKERIETARQTLETIFAQTSALEDQATTQKKLEDRQKKAAEKMQALYADIGMTIKDSVVDGITGAINGTKKLKDVAMDLMNKLLNKLIDFAVNAALFGVGGMGSGGGLLGGLFGGGKAKGGPVSAGTSYIVGEKGPEMFTPSRSGTIIPNNQMGGDVNVSVSVDATGSSVEGNDTQANQLGAAIAAAVKHELIMQKRPGGLLS
jgi:tape measure domain-containing protein